MHFASSGDQEIGHKHPYNHLTLLAKGSLTVGVNGEETSFVAPHMIYIKANTVHMLTAQSDNTVAYCIHALREESGDIIDPNMVPAGVEVFDVLSRLTTQDA
jgi:quercetin dioxygenase-like cupin family protein